MVVNIKKSKGTNGCIIELETMSQKCKDSLFIDKIISKSQQKWNWKQNKTES